MSASAPPLEPSVSTPLGPAASPAADTDACGAEEKAPAGSGGSSMARVIASSEGSSAALAPTITATASAGDDPGKQPPALATAILHSAPKYATDGGCSSCAPHHHHSASSVTSGGPDSGSDFGSLSEPTNTMMATAPTAAAAAAATVASRQLFFAKVAPSAAAEEVRRIFEPFGRVDDINLFRAWATARSSKGCGLVTLGSVDAAAAAREALNGRHVWPGADGPMVVEWCAPSKLGAKAAAAAEQKRGPARAMGGCLGPSSFSLQDRHRGGLLRGLGLTGAVGAAAAPLRFLGSAGAMHAAAAGTMHATAGAYHHAPHRSASFPSLTAALPAAVGQQQLLDSLLAAQAAGLDSSLWLQHQQQLQLQQQQLEATSFFLAGGVLPDFAAAAPLPPSSQPHVNIAGLAAAAAAAVIHDGRPTSSGGGLSADHQTSSSMITLAAKPTAAAAAEQAQALAPQFDPPVAPPCPQVPLDSSSSSGSWQLSFASLQQPQQQPFGRNLSNLAGCLSQQGGGSPPVSGGCALGSQQQIGCSSNEAMVAQVILESGWVTQAAICRFVIWSCLPNSPTPSTLSPTTKANPSTLSPTTQLFNDLAQPAVGGCGLQPLGSLDAPPGLPAAPAAATLGPILLPGLGTHLLAPPSAQSQQQQQQQQLHPPRAVVAPPHSNPLPCFTLLPPHLCHAQLPAALPQLSVPLTREQGEALGAHLSTLTALTGCQMAVRTLKGAPPAKAADGRNGGGGGGGAAPSSPVVELVAAGTPPQLQNASVMISRLLAGSQV